MGSRVRQRKTEYTSLQPSTSEKIDHTIPLFVCSGRKILARAAKCRISPPASAFLGFVRATR